MKNIENEKDPNNIFPNDLNDLIEFGKWELTLLSSLKSDRSYKKNLILIDKEWIYKWEEKTGYIYIKKQIFSYLIKIQKNKQIINEERNKLNNIWVNIKDKYQIKESNNLPKINNKKFFITSNKNTKINAKEKFFIISSDIYSIFEKYFDKNICIKVGGLFNKKKLLMPFNYNDKNINYIYIDMLFLNKNIIYEILFTFPDLNLKIIEKIRKELAGKEISFLITEFNDKEKELIFNDEDGTQYKYEAIYKDIFLKDINKENTPINKLKENNKNENNLVLKIKNSMNILSNLDLNNLNLEELEQKLKEIENENKEMIKLNSNLKEKENALLKEINDFENEKNTFYSQKTQNQNQNLYNMLNNTNFEEEESKLKENLKEMEFKNQHLIDEIQEYQEKENVLNNKYKEAKNEYQKKENELNMKIIELDNKEKMIRSKDDNLMKNRSKKEIEMRKKEEELKKLEKELNDKENELDEKEEEINLEEENNKEIIEEIKNKNEEILDKLKIVKNKEDLNDEINNEELDEEIKKMEDQMNNNLKTKNSKNNNNLNEEENEEMEEREYDDKDKDKEDNFRKLSLNGSSNIKFRKMKSLNQDNPFQKNDIEKKTKSINEKISKNMFSSKELTTPNLSDFFNSNVQKEIEKDKPSLGITKIKQPVNLIAIIQCFAHLIDITEGILDLKTNKFFKEDEKNKISKSYAILIDNLFFPENYGNNTGVYSIDSFYDLIIKENKLLNHLYINSNDLLNFFIGELHKELNTKKTNMPLNENNEYEGLNEKDALCNYLEIFTKNNNSIISKNLFGLLKSKIICQGCKKEIYKFKCYSFLYFDLSEIKQFVNKGKKNNINLIDCFDYYNKPEYLLGENGLFCKNCKCKNTTTILRSIYSSHTIMPIIIDRGDDSNLNKDKIEFPDKLDLSKYVEYKNSSKHFYLCGVVSNFGYSNNFGKFEAFCKMEQNSTWYNYNNEQVSSCSVDEVHNKGMQYILFYHKI